VHLVGFLLFVYLNGLEIEFHLFSLKMWTSTVYSTDVNWCEERKYYFGYWGEQAVG
jgi:hypothetical protein